MRDRFDPIALGRNDGFGLPGIEFVAQVIGIESFISEHGIKVQPLDQIVYAGDLAALAGEKLEADKVSQGVGQGQNLGGQPAFRAAYGLMLSPPFAPLAFW